MTGLEWIVSSVVLIVMIMLIRWIFKEKLNARLRYFLWIIVLVRLLMPVSFAGSSVSVLNLMPGGEVQEQSGGQPEDDTYQGNVQSGIGNAENKVTDVGEKEKIPNTTVDIEEDRTASILDAQSHAAETDTSIWKKIRWEDVLLVIWAVGMVMTGAAFLGSNIHYAMKLRKSRRSFGDGEPKEVPYAQGVGKLPVYITELVSTPCLFGVFRPAIYIRPVDAENQKALNQVLRHEYTHFKHRDHNWAVLRSVCLVLHWYNPLVWVAAYLSKQDGELACDESVTASMSEEERQEYGKLLIALTAEKGRYGEMLSCATTMTGGKKSMKERILRIAKRPKMMIISALAVVALCLVVIVVTFTGAKETVKTATDESGQMQSSENTEPSDEMESEIETVQGYETESEPESETQIEPETEPETKPGEEVALAQPRIFVNDFLMDMNGDGIKDIVRLESVDSRDDADTVTANRESLLESLRGNVAGYMELVLYDGALACESMDDFKVGDEISAEAIVEIIGDCAHPHVGNKQYSCFEENGRGYIIDSVSYVGQGLAGYNYEVFTYNNSWEKVLAAERKLNFETDCWMGAGARDGEFDTYYEEHFPIEEMVEYTLELKEYLDKATIMVDTSMGELEDFKVTTHFEAEGAKPDAYDIWHWYVGDTMSGVALSDVQTPEELRLALEGIRMNNWLYSQFFFLDEEKRTVKIQAVTEDATEIPSYVEEVVNQHGETLFEIHKNGEFGEFSAWKIPEIKWTYTWDLNSRLVDVYSYRMYLYTDNPESVVYIGGMEARENGWFECDYGLCVAYDRESGQCFTVGGNDTNPEEYGFITDMIRGHWDLFKGIYK